MFEETEYQPEESADESEEESVDNIGQIFWDVQEEIKVKTLKVIKK